MGGYNILSFDGGGIRGVLTLVLLKRINKILPGLIAKTDLIAGTSTGSLIALGLANNFTPEELIRLYSEENARFIFSPRYIGGFRPRYDNKHLKRLLRAVFSDNLTLKHLKQRVVITAFKIDGCSYISGPEECWGPVFFNNFPGSETEDISLVDAALASTAVPAIFPAYNNYIDGGVVANNPSVVAISYALDKEAGGQSINDITLLSMGTGFQPYKITRDTTRWGALEWFVNSDLPLPIITLMNDGSNKVDTMISSKLLNKQFYRFNPLLPEKVSLDDYKKIPELKHFANKVDITPVVKWIKRFW